MANNTFDRLDNLRLYSGRGLQNNKTMRLRHIEIFHAIYTRGSITSAARSLNVSQPSVSKVLAHAESQLGYRLFDREKGKVVPTREAEILISNVMGAYSHIGEVRRIARNLGDMNAGLIRFASTPAFGVELVPAVIAAYLAEYPSNQFEIETLHHRQISRAIREHRIDLGLAFDPPPAAEIQLDRLASAKFVALTHESIDFGDKKRLSFADFSGHPFIALSERGPLGRLLASKLNSLELDLHTVATVETYQMAETLVAHGVGVCLLDEVTARSSKHDQTRSWPLEPELKFDIMGMRLASVSLPIIVQRFYQRLAVEVDHFLN